MEISITKAQEIAHYSNEMSQKLNEILSSMHENISKHEKLLEISNSIVENLTFNMNTEEEQRALSILLEIITNLCSEHTNSFTNTLDLLEWSSNKTEKYVTEYQKMAEKL